MESPLAGVRVLEVANYLAVPSAGALMADMGAAVIKVEPPNGDPFRYVLRSEEFNFDFPISYAFELDNRGKQSMALDLNKEESIEVMQRLAKEADVFITNLLPHRRKRYKLRYKDLSSRNPRLVYLACCGYGPVGPEKDRLAFDRTAFWARSGMMSLFSRPGQPPLELRSGVGDHTASPLLVAGVLAALLARERSGKGQEVVTSLLNVGLWAIGADVQRTMAAGQEPQLYPRSETVNPLQNTYHTSDGRWIYLSMLHTDINWVKLCKAFGYSRLSTDPRYRTIENRQTWSKELVAKLDEIFSTKSLKELAPSLDANGITWAPMQSLSEAIDDPHVRANELFTTLEHPNHGPYETLDTPIHFSDSEVGARAAAPEVGQHTEEILLELGYTWKDISKLRNSGAIR